MWRQVFQYVKGGFARQVGETHDIACDLAPQAIV